MDSPSARAGLRKLAVNRAEVATRSRGRQEYVRAPQRSRCAKKRPLILVQAQVLARGHVRPAVKARIACVARGLARSAPALHRKQTISAARLPVPAKRAELTAVCAHNAAPPPEWRIAPAAARDQSSYSGTSR